MYADRERLAAEACRMRMEGASIRRIAGRLGVGRSTAWRWTARCGGGRRMSDLTAPEGLPRVVGDGPVYPDIDPSDKDALIDRLMLENEILRGMNEILKGVRPSEATNREKSLLIDWLRARTGRPLRELTASLRISKSSYEYHRARRGADKYAALRAQVRDVFDEGGARWGYRTVHARLRRRGVRVSEKVVRRLMAEQGLEVVYARRRRRPYSSYAGEVSRAPANLVGRDFRASAPDELWLTDITEFRLPCGAKVYLSPVVDCFDGMPVAWSVGRRPTAELANSSLLKALARRRPGAATVVHSDRGGHYRWPGWVSICEENGLVRSMSAKGCSPDNAAMEGFFGRLKNEFFHYRDWRGVGPEEFMAMLDAEMRYHQEGRIKRSLGWRSPMEYRRDLGYVA